MEDDAQVKVPSIRNPWVEARAFSNGNTKSLGSCQNLVCTTDVTSERIEETGEVLCSRPTPTYGCMSKKAKEPAGRSKVQKDSLLGNGSKVP